jgi:hypothetical protein
LLRTYRIIWLFLAGILLISLACAGETTPSDETALPPTPLPTATPLPQMEIAENAEVSEITSLGQLTVEYPVRMAPGSSDGTIIVSVRIPDVLVSLNPNDIEIKPIPPHAPPAAGARGSDEAFIAIANIMRVELSAPAFKVESAIPATQPVNLAEIDDPTVWIWTLVAPDTPGLHNFTLSVYHGNATQPVWARVYQLEVLPLTPTPPTPTPPPPSFWDRPAGSALIIALAVIIVALIGLAAVLAARGRLPLLNPQAGYRRRLKILTNNLNYLEEQKALYGPTEVPVKLVNEIRLLQEEIAELQEKIK